MTLTRLARAGLASALVLILIGCSDDSGSGVTTTDAPVATVAPTTLPALDYGRAILGPLAPQEQVDQFNAAAEPYAQAWATLSDSDREAACADRATDAGTAIAERVAAGADLDLVLLGEIIDIECTSRP